MCKMAHFGNCDPETADQEYCIFHKPNKSEEEAVEFYRKFLERFKPRVEEIEVDWHKIKRLVFEKPVDARGFVFPKISLEIEYTDPKTGDTWRGTSPFEYAVFEQDAIFSDAIFEDSISFKGAVFKGNAVFEYSEFRGLTTFEGSTFEIESKFKEVVFKEGVEFSGAKFEKKVTFENSKFDIRTMYLSDGEYSVGVSFFGCKFKGDTDFSGAKLTNPSFRYATFEGAVFFKNTTFTKGALEFGTFNFKDTTFEGDANFSSATFDGNVFFVDAEFKKKSDSAIENNEHSKVKFSRCMFNGFADFRNCKCDENVEISFANSIFKDVAAFDFAEFGTAIFNFSVFKDNMEFNEATILKPVEFRRVTFESHVKFLRDKFRDTVTFLDSIFKKDVIFDWSLFEGLVELTAEYHGKLSFKRSAFYLGVQIDWDRVVVKDIDAKKELVRIYVDALKKEGRIKEAYRFALEFKKELNRDRRKKGTIKDKLTAYIEWIALELPSEYLTNWKRTVISSILTILIFGAIYYGISVVGGGGIRDSCCEFSGANISISNNVSIKWTNSFNVTLNKSFTVQNLSSNTIAMATRDNNSLRGCILKETPHIITDILNYIYFSAVTFTTLGYGDFHPVGIVKILASIEAFLGVIYAAMISAILGKELFVEEFEE